VASNQQKFFQSHTLDYQRIVVRYLRIAFSATCGIICLLLIVLWVRSYWWMDCTSLLRKYSLTSFRGDIFIEKPVVINYSGPNPSQVSFSPGRYGISSLPSDLPGLIIGKGGWTFPYWLPIVSTIAVCAAPWLPFRFSLRTLLIALTLVAGVLGAIIYSARIE
jgi:hypothetical protein